MYIKNFAYKKFIHLVIFIIYLHNMCKIIINLMKFCYEFLYILFCFQILHVRQVYFHSYFTFCFELEKISLKKLIFLKIFKNYYYSFLGRFLNKIGCLIVFFEANIRLFFISLIYEYLKKISFFLIIIICM